MKHSIFAVLIALASFGAHAACTYGPEQCRPGYVWREAFAGDKACVLPAVRAQAATDNAQAQARKAPNGRSGPDTCTPGYVWREARASDHVCVTGAVRSQTAVDNAQAASRIDAACRVGDTQVGKPAPVNRPAPMANGLAPGSFELTLNFSSNQQGKNNTFVGTWPVSMQRQGNGIALVVPGDGNAPAANLSGSDASQQMQLAGQFPDAAHRLVLHGAVSGLPAASHGTAELRDTRGQLVLAGTYTLAPDSQSQGGQGLMKMKLTPKQLQALYASLGRTISQVASVHFP